MNCGLVSDADLAHDTNWRTVLVILLVPGRIAAGILRLLLLMTTVSAEHFFEEAELCHRRRRKEREAQQRYKKLHPGCMSVAWNRSNNAISQNEVDN